MQKFYTVNPCLEKWALSWKWSSTSNFTNTQVGQGDSFNKTLNTLLFVVVASIH